MKELLEKIVVALVDQPDQIEVEAVEGARSMVLELKVAKEDIKR
jgi:predicted RNA-binding protein YlqC (UPF0109 family)